MQAAEERIARHQNARAALEPPWDGALKKEVNTEQGSQFIQSP